MIYKKLFILALIYSSLMGMEEQGPKKLLSTTLNFIDGLISEEAEQDFSKKLKLFLRSQNVTKKQKKELKSHLAHLAQPTFYTLKTLAEIKYLDCVINSRESTIAWVDTMDNTFNLNTTKKPQEIVRTGGHAHVISCLAISSCQKYLITGSKGEDALKIWLLKPHIECLATINYFKTIETTKSISCIQFSTNKKHIICSDSVGKVHLLENKIEEHQQHNSENALQIIGELEESNLFTLPQSYFLPIVNDRLISKKEGKIKFWSVTNRQLFATLHINKKRATFTKNDSHFAIPIVVSTLKTSNKPKKSKEKKFLIPDCTELHFITNPANTKQTILPIVLIDQKAPFKIATIFIPEVLSFKKLYVHMAIRKAFKDSNAETLIKLRKSDMLAQYGTPMLIRGFIDIAISKLQ